VYFLMAAVSSSEKGSSPQKTSEHGLKETPDSDKKIIEIITFSLIL